MEKKVFLIAALVVGVVIIVAILIIKKSPSTPASPVQSAGSAARDVSSIQLLAFVNDLEFSCPLSRETRAGPGSRYIEYPDCKQGGYFDITKYSKEKDEYARCFNKLRNEVFSRDGPSMDWNDVKGNIMHCHTNDLILG